MKTLFLASTLFLTDVANFIAGGIDKLDWQEDSKKREIEVLSTDVPDSSLLLFHDGQGMQITDPFTPSNEKVFSSQYEDNHGHATGNGAFGRDEGKAIDIASINFLVPKERNIRYEGGALVWEVKL